MINIGLIGFGRIGKKYYKTILDNKNYNLIKILKKKKFKKTKQFKKFFTNKYKFFSYKKKETDAYIVASPINTHYKYIIEVLSQKKPIIIEKPIVANLKELNKFLKLSKDLKSPLIVNYSDLYSDEFKFFKKKIKLIGKFKKIKIDFGKFQKIYRQNKNTVYPYFDWLPHPLAIAISLAGPAQKINMIHADTVIIKKYIFQKIHLSLNCKNKKIDIFFSNNYKRPRRLIEIKGEKGTVIYDLYKKKSVICKLKNKKTELYSFNNFTPLENLLIQFRKLIANRINVNDLNLSIKVMKIIFSLKNKVEKKKNI